MGFLCDLARTFSWRNKSVTVELLKEGLTSIILSKNPPTNFNSLGYCTANTKKDMNKNSSASMKQLQLGRKRAVLSALMK